MARSILTGLVLIFGLAAAQARAEEKPGNEPEPVEREALIEQTTVGAAVIETAAPGPKPTPPARSR